jgi:hypothetical protein
MVYTTLTMLTTSKIALSMIHPSLKFGYGELCQWLWPRVLQRQLDIFMEFRNGCRMRKDKKKPGPSGMSWNQAFSLPEEWGGRNCLLKIEDFSVIKDLKEELGGDELISFSTPEFHIILNT